MSQSSEVGGKNYSWTRLGVWWTASRPKTLWASVTPVVMGTVMALEAGRAHLPAALAALVAAVLIQAGTNLANDYFDFRRGVDQPGRLGPVRVTQAGLVKPEVMAGAIVVTFLAAGAAGMYLVMRGGWPILVIGVILIASGIFYSAGPRPLSFSGWADLFVLIFFGPVAVAGSYYVQALELSWPVVAIGLGPGLLSVAMLTVNNLRDMEMDATAGKQTLCVRFGAAFGRWEYLLCVLCASLIPAIVAAGTGGHFWAASTAAVMVPAAPSIRRVFVLANSAELNGVLAATGRLMVAYGAFFSAGWLL